MRIIFVCLITVCLVIGCAGKNASAGANGVSQSTISIQDFEENEWKLIEVHIAGRDSQYRRDAQIEDGNFFTFRFNQSVISGVGAPNRFSGPATVSGENNSIKIGLLRSTLMAALFEPEHLKEHDFYTYLQNTYEMALVSNNLVFNSKTEDGRDVKLVFNR